MADLKDFFAKRDLKKKKGALKAAAATSEVSAPGIGLKSDRQNAAQNQGKNPAPAAQKSAQVDDGWIEIEDPKTLQVNTGGRTVGQLKKGPDDSDQTGDSDAQAEKFTGWFSKEKEVEMHAPASEEEAKNDLAPPVVVGSQFPSLQDAANAPQVPVAKQSAPTSASNRPRFFNSNPNKFAGLRKLLEERDE